MSGCSDGGGGTSTAPPASPSTPAAGGPRIIIKDFKFVPASLLGVRPGAKVTVVNMDSVPHTVTATGSGSFDTGNIEPGKTATFVAPSKAGSYPYDCDIHEYMEGTLTVG
ncbi:metal-binding protein [Streptomyces piniterrae]|uniref:Metal-binding protein n=1 Tax=Streptomyces piniterrae TaxID=2571125 RepID=A0A4U0N7D2_9ACTN|nr:metal-binding protein [Streptomyces piniterrae]